MFKKTKSEVAVYQVAEIPNDIVEDITNPFQGE